MIKLFLRFLYVALIFIGGFSFAYYWYSGFEGFSGLLDSVQYSPSDFLNTRDILVYQDRIVILVDNAEITNYEDSGSMAPTLGKGVNGINVKPESPEEIDIGDIISFRKEGEVVVHRVIEKGEDDKGIYFITKGDNNDFNDGKVRFSDIEHVLVGLVY